MHCSQVWGGAPNSSLRLLNKVQSKSICPINNLNLTNDLQSLSHHSLDTDLSIFYHYFHRHCSLEIKNIIPVPVRHVQATRSPTHSHSFQVILSNRQTLASSFIPRTSQLWNSLPSTTFMSPTTYHLSNLTSRNLILSPYLLNLSLFS